MNSRTLEDGLINALLKRGILGASKALLIARKLEDNRAIEMAENRFRGITRGNGGFDLVIHDPECVHSDPLPLSRKGG